LFLPKFFSYFQIQLSNKVNLNAFAWVGELIVTKNFIKLN
jgi:hypothetical protein